MENNLEKTKFYAYDKGKFTRVNKCLTELTETEEIQDIKKGDASNEDN